MELLGRGLLGPLQSHQWTEEQGSEQAVAAGGRRQAQSWLS